MNSLQQQARFDDFVQEFNAERPHDALAMKCPAEIYSASLRPYSGLPDLTYPLHDRAALVTACGRIYLHRKRLNVSIVLAGQRLRIKEVDHSIRSSAHALRSRLHRSGTENPTTPRQP